MAQYHFHQSFVQRSQGSSVVAHAAYIAGDALLDTRTAINHTYTSKQHVAVSAILAPDSAEDWVYDRALLWNAVEQFEDDLAHRRFRGHRDPDKNKRSLRAREDYMSLAQTGLKVRGSLPLELTLDQSQEAVESFLKQRFVSRGLIVDYALHWESGNPHFHALVTLRKGEGHTFSDTKDRDICTKESLKISRKLWEEIGNQALEKAGRTERWTCHSYKDLGIEVIPTTHRGWYADHLESKNHPSRIGLENEDRRQQNLKIFLDKPEEIIKIVAQHHTVFTQKHVEKEIMKRVGHDQVLLEILQKKCAAVLEQQASIASQEEGSSNDLSLRDHISQDELSDHASPQGVPSDDISSRDTSFHDTSFHDTSSHEISFHEAFSSGKVSQDKTSQASSPLISPSPSFSYLGRNANDNLVFEGCFERFKERTVSAYAQALLSQTDPAHPTLDGRLTDIIPLGPTVKRQASYVRGMDQEKEQRVVDTLRQLLTTSSLTVKEETLKEQIHIMEAAEGFLFSPEQHRAITHLNQASQITVLTGRAGTGKTTLLKPLVQAYEQAGYRVRGTAFQGKIADLLTRELGIESRTLDSFQRLFERLNAHEVQLSDSSLRGQALAWVKQAQGRYKEQDLTDRDVIILDEANMVSLSHWDNLLSRVDKSGAKLIVIQDPAQIKPLFGADMSRVLETQATPAVLTTVHRQKDTWMKEASVAFNHHDILEGLKAYDTRGYVKVKDTLASAHNALVADYVNTLVSHPHQNTKILTFQNKHVYALNQHVQHHLKARGDLGEALRLGSQTFHVGDQVMFTQNSSKDLRCLEDASKSVHPLYPTEAIYTPESQNLKGHNPRIKNPRTKNQEITNTTVKNGTLGRIEAYEDTTVKVRLQDGRLMGVRDTYQHITLGYALTVNKAEGETFDRVMGYADPHMSPNQWLILGTRHKEALTLYVSQEHAPTLKHLAHLAGNRDERSLISDYTVTPATRPSFDHVQQYYETTLALTEVLQDLRQEGGPHEEGLTSRASSSSWETYALLKDTQKELALIIHTTWEACRPFTQPLGLKKHTLAYQAGLDTRPLTPLEDEARERVGLYRKMAQDTRALWITMTQDALGGVRDRTDISKEDACQDIFRHDTLKNEVVKNEAFKNDTPRLDLSLSNRTQGDLSSHPLYEDYLTHQAKRHELAYAISSHFDLHRPFLKMERVAVSPDTSAHNTLLHSHRDLDPGLDPSLTQNLTSPGGSPQGNTLQGDTPQGGIPLTDNPLTQASDQGPTKIYRYKDQCDQLFDHPPYGQASIEKDTRAYITQQREAYHEKHLSESQHQVYRDLKEYRTLMHLHGRLYHTRKSRSLQGVSTVTRDQDQAQLKALAHRRDTLAFQIMTHHTSFETFFKPLALTPDTFLKHACQGEVRLACDTYLKAITTEEHRASAMNLKTLIDGSDPKICHRAFYALAKDAGVDPQRLRFECALYGSSPSISLKEIKDAYKPMDSLTQGHDPKPPHRERPQALFPANTDPGPLSLAHAMAHAMAQAKSQGSGSSQMSPFLHGRTQVQRSGQEQGHGPSPALGIHPKVEELEKGSRLSTQNQPSHKTKVDDNTPHKNREHPHLDDFITPKLTTVVPMDSLKLSHHPILAPPSFKDLPDKQQKLLSRIEDYYAYRAQLTDSAQQQNISNHISKLIHILSPEARRVYLRQENQKRMGDRQEPQYRFPQDQRPDQKQQDQDKGQAPLIPEEIPHPLSLSKTDTIASQPASLSLKLPPDQENLLQDMTTLLKHYATEKNRNQREILSHKMDDLWDKLTPEAVTVMRARDHDQSQKEILGQINVLAQALPHQRTLLQLRNIRHEIHELKDLLGEPYLTKINHALLKERPLETLDRLVKTLSVTQDTETQQHLRHEITSTLQTMEDKDSLTHNRELKYQMDTLMRPRSQGFTLSLD